MYYSCYLLLNKLINLEKASLGEYSDRLCLVHMLPFRYSAPLKGQCGVVNGLAQNLDKIELMKDKQAVKKSLLSFTTHFFPKTEKVYDTQNPQESINVMRSLCTTNPKGIQWRDARSYLVAEEVQWDAQEDAVVISGVVRGKGLKADRLVYIQGHGDFQVAKVLSISCLKPRRLTAIDLRFIWHS